MDNKIDRDLVDTVKKHAIAHYPNEACGLILQSGKNKTEIVLCENTHEEPTGYFRISRIEYTKLADRGKVLGIWHTHPDRSSHPSDADRVGCEVSGVPWYVMGLSKEESGEFVFDEIQTFSPSGFEMAYTGRPYVPNIFDCWTLVIDYYSREFGIQINRYPFVLEDGRPGTVLFAECYHKEGLVQLINEAPKAGDVFFIQDISHDLPNHAAIYVGDDKILHHSLNRLSKHDIYGGYYEKHTVIHTRHKDLL